MIEDRQVRKVMKELGKSTTTKAMAALKAGMDPKTARKYIKAGKLPSELAKPHTWRTRPDPFAADWPALAGMLVEDPELEATLLMEYLLAEHPGRYEPGQVRTLQRRLARWRAQHGPERRVFFAQEHVPGEAGQTDFTNGNALEVTIAGEAFPHLLCQFVLPYSNWRWVTVARSESLLALRRGVQAALFRLARRPEWHQTDNSTAATHDLRTGKRGFNADYEAVMRHFGMKPRTIGVGESEQNGDVESANGVLKRKIAQRLKLRRSKDFESVDAYEAWLQSLCEGTNAVRGKRLVDELAAMTVIEVSRLRDYDELDVPVRQWSTIRVKENVYSVPSRLIGETVQVRLYERHIEVLFAGRKELEAERLVGRCVAHIDYRHLIWSLVRKPGAFARYKYREQLFPTLTFRRTYDALQAAGAKDIEYLRVLHLAASTMQAEVEAGLDLLLGAGEMPTAERVKALMGKDKPIEAPQLAPPIVDLRDYDALLGRAPPGQENTGT
ncbi:MAG: IS21 family transposase [Myxococcota bacterium]